LGQIAFHSSTPGTLGIELELQLIHPDTFDLTPVAPGLIDALQVHPLHGSVKPEITRAMIEINSAVHDDPGALLTEMRQLRDAVCEGAAAVRARIAGGGTHPFMRWQDRRIFDSPRFEQVAGRFGYLASKFTVFGQHIHLGVSSGDDAIAMIRRLMPYTPHLVAMAASSPYQDGIDTQFASSRPHAINGFPLAGHMPEEISDWYGFEAYMMTMRAHGLIDDLKELYWDIRPKPEIGTVEIRVCDTPLSVERACQIAAFAQALGAWVADAPDPGPLAWLAYRVNHFEACRFGLRADYVDTDGSTVCLRSHLDHLFDQLMPFAQARGAGELLSDLRSSLTRQGNDARWLRTCLQQTGNLPGVVAQAADVFQGVVRDGGLR
jgi:carboxylate-amine ligase